MSVVTKLLQDFNKTPIKRLKDSYQEFTGHSAAKYSTPINRLQDALKDNTALLSKDYRTPIKRLQDAH